IPSLLVSVAGGIVITRASSESTLGADVTKQLFGKRRPLIMAASVVLALALIPGLPKVSFIMLAAGIFAVSRMGQGRAPLGKEAAALAAPGAKTDPKAAPAVDPMDAAMKLDDLTLEVGFGLVPLADAKQGGQLLTKVRALRKHLAKELGFLVPPIHITDNLSL